MFIFLYNLYILAFDTTFFGLPLNQSVLLPFFLLGGHLKAWIDMLLGT